MKSYYRTLVLVLVAGMPFGYSPVTDTLGSALGLDFLSGKSDYFQGCHNPPETIEFKEIHLGYGRKLDENLSVHVDGGLVPTRVSPLDEFEGGRNLFGYIAGRCDIDWERLGLGLGVGNISPYIEPYVRFGVRKYLYLDGGIAHRYPLGGSGVANVGLGSGFGTDKLNFWIGFGSGLRCGGLHHADLRGYCASLDCRVTGNFGLRAGALRGCNNSESAWLGVSYYFK